MNADDRAREPPEGERVVIVFADICGSTPLYERSGDRRALEIVADRLDGLARTARAHGGRVIRSKGDDVLCTFDAPAAALDAAAEMLGTHGHGEAPVRAGMHLGPVIHARDDIFGDAVNVAARILALAKAGEVLASGDLVGALGVPGRERMARLGSRELKGKREPLALYSMVLDEGDATQIAAGHLTTAASPVTAMPQVSVELGYGARSVRIGDGERCLIGRAQRCDLVIDSLNVSREHAWVAVTGARVTVTDQSSGGTWVIDSTGSHKRLRREQAELHGSGRLRLGTHPREPGNAVEVAFALRGI